jgi:hypothetical protein
METLETVVLIVYWLMIGVGVFGFGYEVWKAYPR